MLDIDAPHVSYRAKFISAALEEVPAADDVWDSLSPVEEFHIIVILLTVIPYIMVLIDDLVCVYVLQGIKDAIILMAMSVQIVPLF